MVICHWKKQVTDCETPWHVFRVCFVLHRLYVCKPSYEFACSCRVQFQCFQCAVWMHTVCAYVCFCVHETLLKTSQCSVAAAPLWKWIVGILYLSMPPFGPWNARAYFPIMALSCSQLPWEPRCSPRSALLTPSFTEVWRGRWGGKEGNECAMQCHDEWTLMRDSYYAELIILSLHWGDCQ